MTRLLHNKITGVFDPAHLKNSVFIFEVQKTSEDKTPRYAISHTTIESKCCSIHNLVFRIMYKLGVVPLNQNHTSLNIACGSMI